MELKEIDISQIIARKSSVRIENVDEGIEDLTESIKNIGLLQPIIVKKNPNGQFVLLAGQRRYTAFEQLNKQYPGEGFEKIFCNVMKSSDEFDENAFSISESLTQLPMTLTDVIDACNLFFEKYNDERIVAKKFGISTALVKKYVKFARLPKLLQDNLKSINENPKTSISIALDANDALGWSPDSGVSDQKVYDLAMKLGEKKKKSPEEYDKLKQAAEEHPEYSLEQIEESEKNRSPKEYRVILDSNTLSHLDALAEEQGVKSEDLLMDALNDYIARHHSENND